MALFDPPTLIEPLEAPDIDQLCAKMPLRSRARSWASWRPSIVRGWAGENGCGGGGGGGGDACARV